MTSTHQPIPATPKVISPSPTPSEHSNKDGYFAPVTRSKTPNRAGRVDAIPEAADDHPDLGRARTRKRKSHAQITNEMNGTITEAKDSMPYASGQPSAQEKEMSMKPLNDDLLSPKAAYRQAGFGSSYWRNLSRSPSPLGLIPIHQDFRAFIHRHEIPRKVLHVSIGFFALWLYHRGVQTSSIHPVLLTLLIPIFTVDLIRFNWPAFNDFYIKVLGAFMRESEAHDRFNGVISYLAGLWATMYFCKKDVAIMSVLLLSWCDTAASTFGRAFGKYTPKVRRGKSLAGSIACFAFGVGSAYLFWGVIAPRTSAQAQDNFAFQGTLSVPQSFDEHSQWQTSSVTALAILSLASGLIASISEAIDLWGLDDNLTIPILTGAGLSLFLWLFGRSLN